MKHRLLALSALLLAGGCGVLEPAATPVSSPTTTAVPSPTSTGTATSGRGAAKDSGELPDPCTLLTGTQVAGITGREVTRVDQDGAGTGGITRFCQWQQAGGQLALFLTRTTPADFEVTVADAEPVPGVGENAHRHSGHLYVLYGTVQVDVYSRGSSDARNLADAKKVAQTIIPDL